VKRDETRTEGVGVSSSDPLRPASRAQAARSAAPWLTPPSRARRATFLFSKSRAESSASLRGYALQIEHHSPALNCGQRRRTGAVVLLSLSISVKLPYLVVADVTAGESVHRGC
jgi:hypothetical protein